MRCDYTIYPDNKISYGFITRGCIRNCSFCVVPKKEGYIHQVNKLDDIIRHKVVKFLDNNILAFRGHKKILQELINRKVKCEFNQGMDIRLIDDENAELLSKLNYIDRYTFAFDDKRQEKIITEKMNIAKRYIGNDCKLRFFIYCHPDMDIKNDVYYRIMWCRKNKVIPYLMRHISCWDSKNRKLYIDLASWCNQPHIFRKMDFEEFIIRRHTNNPARIDEALKMMYY